MTRTKEGLSCTLMLTGGLGWPQSSLRTVRKWQKLHELHDDQTPKTASDSPQGWE